MVQIPWICRREVTWIGVVLSPYSPAPVPRILFGGGVGPPIREDLRSEVMRRTLFWGEDLMSMEDVQCSKSERSSNHRGIPERYAMISLLGGRACLAGPRQSTSVPRRYGEDGIKALPQAAAAVIKGIHSRASNIADTGGSSKSMIMGAIAQDMTIATFRIH
uniref:Uncharacterized protein n=1 Tax=Oryza nivara TaxID=4536 RepID=A0A0E0J0U6_ORYNI